jgi:hypothetical protein
MLGACAPLLTLALLAANPSQADLGPSPQAHIDVLQQHARPPLEFVTDKLDQYDFIVFDDAWHPCAQPWEFYQELVTSPDFRKKANHVFVEAIPINMQKYVDAYLRSDPEDVTLLYPAFQDDLSGTGWSLKSYFDLLHAIWEANHPVGRGLGEDERIRVIAVNAPTYWGEIETGEDVALFRKSLVGNDYTMYRVIVDEMEGFSGARKGVFLTNTRHVERGHVPARAASGEDVLDPLPQHGAVDRGGEIAG